MKQRKYKSNKTKKNNTCIRQDMQDNNFVSIIVFMCWLSHRKRKVST